MTAKKTPDDLRCQAEALLPSDSQLKAARFESDELQHELQVHQIELELQNEELRRTQIALEESRDLYHDMYEFAPFAYLTLTSQGCIDKINQTGAALLGISREKLLKRRFAVFIEPIDTDRWHLFFVQTLKKNQRQSIDLVLKCGNNGRFHARLDCLPVLNADKQPTLWIALTDISQHQQTILELARTEEKYHILFNLIQDGIVFTTMEGKITGWNPYFAQMLGYEKDEIVKLTYQQITPPKWHSMEAQIVRQQVMLQGYSPPYEKEYIRKDGSIFPVELRTCLIRDVQGNPAGLWAIVTDITERKRIKQVLIEACATAEQANQAKSEFIANMSHELRTPMNAIIGMTYLTQHTELTEKQRNYLNKIDCSSHILLRIINNILDFSKIEAGKLELEHERFSLREVLDHLGNMLDFSIKEKNVELLFSVAPHIPNLLIGDSLRLSQILLNLLNNAVKFSDSNITVAITPKQLSADFATLQFSVQDKGIGISPDQIRRLFQPFSQVDSSTTRKYGGTGLGLAISKQLAELMDGKIWLESEPGRGSTFFFTARFGIAEPNSLLQINHKVANFCVELTGKKVLLVEDDAINRELATELLTDLGIEVKVAVNGKQAVDLVKNESFDLVLMDIQMPEMDGLAATRLIRADERFFDLPILAMTAYAMSSDRQKSLAVGMNDYLVKPINPKKLADALGYWFHAKLQPAKTAHTPVKKLSESKLPAELRPFNLVAALQRVKGNRHLLHKLILMFHDDFINITEKLRQLIAAGDYETARQLAHKLRGAAMILEIDEVPNIVAIAEQAMQRRDAAKINLYLKTLETVLEPAIQAAASLPPLPDQN